jgi:hypothetical protein
MDLSALPYFWPINCYQMKKITFSFLLGLFVVLFVTGQSRVLVLNEGVFDYTNNKILIPPSVGAYSPSNQEYQPLVDIPQSRFASDLKIHDGSYWVAADQKVVRYHLQTNAIQWTLPVEGVRKIDFWENYLILTRGEYEKTLSAYVQIYDMNNSSLVFEIPHSVLPYTTESIIIKEDHAFIGVNNGFQFGKEVGQILDIDLHKLKWVNTIDLGSDGKNPENLMLKDNVLYSLNNRDYTGSSLSKINLNSAQVLTSRLPEVNSLCATSTLIENSIVYQESGKTGVGKYDLATENAGPFLDPGKQFYGLSFDARSKFIYAAETDFFSFGKVFVFDQHFTKLDEFDAGITPGYFAFDYSLSATEQGKNETALQLAPNPGGDFISLPEHLNAEQIHAMDLMGKRVNLEMQNGKLNLSTLPSGIYLIKLISNGKIYQSSFQKI